MDIASSSKSTKKSEKQIGQQKNIIVSVFLTESATSLLKFNAPYLEDLRNQDSNVFIIEKNETDYIKKPSKIVDSTSSILGPSPKNSKESILSEIAFFGCKSYSSVSFLDTYSEDERLGKFKLCENTPKNIPFILQPTNIRTRPLVTVRSIAHSNKLNIMKSNIYLAMLNSQSSLNSGYICRICHGGESIEDLLTPCRCRGTIALVHLPCLERWLVESSHSQCELCQHHYEIIKEPKYSVLQSIFMYFKSPGGHWKVLLEDILGFLAYTPTAFFSTYLLLMVCENIAKHEAVKQFSYSSNIIAVSAIFGIAIIDFTYTSWLMIVLQKHFDAWADFYNKNSTLRIILPKAKRKSHKLRTKTKKIAN